MQGCEFDPSTTKRKEKKKYKISQKIFFFYFSKIGQLKQKGMIDLFEKIENLDLNFKNKSFLDQIFTSLF